jgi:hypothetical protein
MPRWTDII